MMLDIVIEIVCYMVGVAVGALVMWNKLCRK